MADADGAAMGDERSEAARCLPAGHKWQCDVCQHAQFNSYEEAMDHERRCKKQTETTTLRLTHQNGKKLGLVLHERNSCKTIAVSKESVLFDFVRNIREDAAVIFLPDTDNNCSSHRRWEEMEDSQLDSIVDIALEHGTPVKFRNGSVGMGFMNEGALKAALRGDIRPDDTLTKINSTTIKDLCFFLGEGEDLLAKIVGVLKKPESYPLTITLLRRVDDDESTTTRSRDMSELQELDLDENIFVRNGEWSRILNGLNQMNSLTKLHLDNNLIGREGCASISTLLKKREGSKLTYLSLRENLIDDECLSMFADALKGNDALQTLDVYGSKGRITESGWECVLSLMCNTSSIEHTFTSNHTLNSLGEWDFPQICPAFGRRLEEMININTHASSRFSPARKKTWHVHFNSDNFDIQPLIEVDAKLMPRVLAWFANHNYPSRSVRLRRLFRLIRNCNIPELFGIPSAERSRIGSRVAELETQVEQLKAEIQRMNAKNKDQERENNDENLHPSKRMKT